MQIARYVTNMIDITLIIRTGIPGVRLSTDTFQRISSEGISLPRCICLLLLVVSGYASRPTFAQVNRPEFSASDVVLDARSAALQASGLEGDVSVGFGGLINAAAMLQVTDVWQVALSHVNHLDAVQQNAVVVYSPSQWRIGLHHLSWGELDRRDATNDELGTFRAQELIISGGKSHPLTPSVSVGALAHGQYSQLAEARAARVLLDAALRFQSADRRTRLTVQGRVASPSVASQLPVARAAGALEFGASSQLRYLPLRVHARYRPLGWQSAGPATSPIQDIRLGGELYLGEAMVLRLGYSFFQHDQLAVRSRLDFAGTGVGLGIRLKRAIVDYGSMSWSDSGRVHVFTIRLRR